MNKDYLPIAIKLNEVSKDINKALTAALKEENPNLLPYFIKITGDLRDLAEQLEFLRLNSN